MYKLSKSIIPYTADVQVYNGYVGTHYVYVLKNPADDVIFYVGKTSKDIKIRMSGHLSDSGDGTDKGEMIKRILDVGATPLIEIIETIHSTCYIDSIKILSREIYWISFYKKKVSLTNRASMHDSAYCVEYKQYKTAVEKGELYLKFYYCGQNRHGVAIYDIEKMLEDGFIIDLEPPEEPANLPSLVKNISYEYNYDDESPDYIRGSIEEM